MRHALAVLRGHVLVSLAVPARPAGALLTVYYLGGHFSLQIFRMQFHDFVATQRGYTLDTHKLEYFIYRFALFPRLPVLYWQSN